MSSVESINKHKKNWEECSQCTLGKARRDRNELMCLGKGALPADLLVVVPRPLFQNPQAPTPYEVDSEEHKMMTQICQKVGIDRQKMHVTSTVVCQPEKDQVVNIDHVIACRSRLKELTAMVNPKAVMLMGPEAMFAWTNENIGILEKGPVELDEVRSTMWTHDFTRYLNLKQDDPAKAAEQAKELFSHWQWIADKMK